jgi:dynein assembly factor 5
LNDLALNTFENSSLNEIYEKFASQLFADLKQTSNDWLRSTRDRFIFETFIMQAGEKYILRKAIFLSIFLGSSNRFFLKDILEILRAVMNPDRDPEVRNQCLLIIANLLQFIDDIDATTTTINPYLTVLINECIIPNMQWKAGRTAAAIRATAIATLWSLFQAKSFSFEQVRC